jgi:hypothetical protein
VRLVEKSLLRAYRNDDVVACFPDDLAQVCRAAHACRCCFYAQSARRDVRRRSLHVHLRLVANAINSHYSRDLFAKIKGESISREFQGDRRRFRWLADYPDEYLRRAERRLRVEGRSESVETLELFRKAIQGEELPRRVEVKHPMDATRFCFPTRARLSAWSR